MNTIVVPLMVLSLGLASCKGEPVVQREGAKALEESKKPQKQKVSVHELAVIVAVLSHRYKAPEKPFVLVRDTQIVHDERATLEYLKNPKMKSLFKDLTKLSRVLAVTPGFKNPAVQVFADEKQVDAIFDKGWWDDFYREFPGSGGMIQFSRAAFAGDRNAALIYHGRSAGGLNADGSLYYLKRLKGKWHVEDVVLVWIS